MKFQAVQFKKGDEFVWKGDRFVVSAAQWDFANQRCFLMVDEGKRTMFFPLSFPLEGVVS